MLDPNRGGDPGQVSGLGIVNPYWVWVSWTSIYFMVIMGGYGSKFLFWTRLACLKNSSMRSF